MVPHQPPACSLHHKQASFMRKSRSTYTRFVTQHTVENFCSINANALNVSSVYVDRRDLFNLINFRILFIIIQGNYWDNNESYIRLMPNIWRIYLFFFSNKILNISQNTEDKLCRFKNEKLVKLMIYNFEMTTGIKNNKNSYKFSINMSFLFKICSIWSEHF